MNQIRPDPDELLARVKQDEARARRGRLKIFFGMSPGVGKTYTMLADGQLKRGEGLDVVVGVVETHKRADTAALVQGLECLPLRELQYQGHRLREFDLDAALKRRPGLLLVDELAHSNAHGSRHSKRWQDVEELIAAGIDVYTTVNVQHLESVNDLVSSITGIRVQETFPDRVFDEADDVELVDLPPDELLQRLQDGKVYIPEQAERAAQHFFRKGNLIALRELALRRTTERVESQMRDYRERHAIDKVWSLSDHLLVAIGPTPDAENLVRAGKRLARALNAAWTVVYVDTPKLQSAPKAARERLLKAVALADSLGAETVTLAGPLISAEILGFAQARNISKLLVGKPETRGWRRWLFGSAIDTIIREARQIDVFVIGLEGNERDPKRVTASLLAVSQTYEDMGGDEEKRERERIRITKGAAIIAATTVLAWPIHERFDNAVLIMFYLLGVVLTAVRYGRIASIVASVLAVASFDFFFVPPYLTFSVSDTQYLFTFAAMLIVALVISGLASGLRLQARIAGFRERRVAELYAMSSELAGMREREEVAACAVRHVNTVIDGQSAILLPDAFVHLQFSHRGSQHDLYIPDLDLVVAQWVYAQGKPAGHGTDTLPSADALFLPLQGSHKVLGVLALRPRHWLRLREPEQLQQMQTFGGQIAQALERVELALQMNAAQTASATERLRNSLLSAISHDLRTPLATVIGAASTLLQQTALGVEVRQQLCVHIRDEAARMNELVNKVLDMARLQAGAIRLEKEWLSLEELIGAALNGLREKLQAHHVVVQLPVDLPLVLGDAVLLQRVFANLFENATKYTPAGSTVRVTAQADAAQLHIRIADDGPGLKAGSERQVFEKFYREHPESASSGVGLGLTICAAIIAAHGGTIEALANTPRGCVFAIDLPQQEAPPAPLPETMETA